METKREGFWQSAEEPHLPAPQPEALPWEGQGVFVQALSKVQASRTPRAYRGVSQCRLCGCANGHLEFALFGYVWPQGLMHYVTDHNVKPSSDFRDFIAYNVEALEARGA